MQARKKLHRKWRRDLEVRKERGMKDENKGDGQKEQKCLWLVGQVKKERKKGDGLRRLRRQSTRTHDKEIMTAERGEERCGWTEETSGAKQRRWTKGKVITAQRELDESTVMVQADGAPLPNQRESLMRNSKWNRLFACCTDGRLTHSSQVACRANSQQVLHKTDPGRDTEGLQHDPHRVFF